MDLSAADLSLTTGESFVLFATPRDAAGRELTGRAVTWRSSDATIAAVSATSLVTALAEGSATITATSEGRSGSALLTIEAPPAYDLLFQRSVPDTNEVYVFALGVADARPARVNAGRVARHPSPSPDGTRIAFAVSMTGPAGESVDYLYVVDRDGLDVRRLTTAAGVDDMPAWSAAAARRADGPRLLGRHLEREEAYADAAAVHRRAVEADALDEDAQRSLMRCLARAGERGQALRQYERLVALLRADLDAEPERETTALYDRLRHAEPV